MNQHYGGVIWTNHALDRLKERGISQQEALITFTNSDQSRYAATRGGWVYYKTYGNRKIEVVAKQNERKEWVILTVWERPVYGTEHKKQSFWLRLFRQIFFGDYR